MLNELRARVERFYQRATREQIQEATRVVQSLLAAKGLLPEQASKKINRMLFSPCDPASLMIPFLATVRSLNQYSSDVRRRGRGAFR